MLIDILKVLISSKTISYEELLNKLDIFYALNRISEEDYIFLFKQIPKPEEEKDEFFEEKEEDENI